MQSKLEQLNQANVFEDMKKEIKRNLFKPESPAISFRKPIQLETSIDKGQFGKQAEGAEQENVIALSQSSILRGIFAGAILTAAIGFNAGKYSRLGAFRKKIRFIRKLITPNRKPSLVPFTNYFYPNIKTVTKNIMCFSGQQGIGKSYHFQRIAYVQSLVRPALYLSFKATGIGRTFQEDLATKLDYGQGQNPPMLSQILSAVRSIDYINTYPYRLWAKVVLAHAGFAWAADAIIQSNLLEANEGICLGMLGTAYVYYFYMIYPWIIQSIRQTKPLIIFDDINKIDNLGMLAQIARFLQIHEQNIGNVILIASDEQTWFKLRKQPGLKDRLRQRVITYDHNFTMTQMLNFISKDSSYIDYIETYRVSPLYTKELVSLLIRQLIGNRQVTIRRLRSILVLNDEEQYQMFVKVLVSCREGKMSNEEAVVKITDILYNSQMETICAKLKHIKRQINISDEEFINQMRFLLEKGKLPSDNLIAPYLMSYNIVRDNKSEFVFNGKFMYTVFQMAYQEYTNDLKQFYNDRPGLFEVQPKYNSKMASREEQKKKANQLDDQQKEQILEKAKIYDNTK